MLFLNLYKLTSLENDFWGCAPPNSRGTHHDTRLALSWLLAGPWYMVHGTWQHGRGGFCVLRFSQDLVKVFVFFSNFLSPPEGGLDLVTYRKGAI